MIDALLAALLLSGLGLLGASRLRTAVGLAAFQGLVGAALALAVHADWTQARPWILAAGSALLKGAAFPWLLFRALDLSAADRERRPFVGATFSVAFGILALGLALRVGGRLPLPEPPPSDLVLPVSLFLLQAGLFLIVARRSAVLQVVGYLTLENGLYVFGVGLVHGQPFLVEIGILLDVFVAVFVMGIAIYRMGRELDSTDTERLTTLKD